METCATISPHPSSEEPWNVSSFTALFISLCFISNFSIEIRSDFLFLQTNISQQPPAPKPRSINARPNNENPANETRPTSFMRDKNARPVPAQRKSLMSPDEHSEGSGAHVTSPPSVLPKPNRRTSCDSSLDVDNVSLYPVPEFGGAWLSDTRAIFHRNRPSRPKPPS